MEVELGSDVKQNVKIVKLFDHIPRGYYVYIHRKATSGEIFYVGKGRKDRGWKNDGRNLFWIRTANKYGCNCEIVLDNLTEDQALELEREYIAFFGRYTVEGGTLTNLMHYGTESPGLYGKDHPASNKRIYHFVNVFTFESFIGMHADIKEKKGINMKTVLSDHCLVTLSGWTTMDILSTTDIAYLRRPGGAKPSKEIYHFFNMETEEELRCTKLEFLNKTGLDPCFVTRRSTVLIGNWCLYENKHKWYSMHKDYRKFTFLHEDGRQYYTTRLNFERQTGVRTRQMFKQYNPNFTAHGWRVIK